MSTKELTELQMELVRRLASGETLQAIAFAMKRSPASIKSNKTRLLRKLGIRGRINVALFAVQQGIFDPTTGEDSAPDSEILTTRQREVLTGVASGQSHRQIAQELGISLKSAENHRRRAMRKLGLSDRVQVFNYCVRHGLITLDARTA